MSEKVHYPEALCNLIVSSFKNVLLMIGQYLCIYIHIRIYIKMIFPTQRSLQGTLIRVMDLKDTDDGAFVLKASCEQETAMGKSPFF